MELLKKESFEADLMIMPMVGLWNVVCLFGGDVLTIFQLTWQYEIDFLK